MARTQILNAAHALRKEGIQIVTSQDGRFPSFVVYNPSERLRKQGVELVINKGGERQVVNATMVCGCTVYWQ